VDAIFYVRVGACAVTFASCLPSLAVLLVFVCRLRVWNTFVHRIKLYLMAAALAVSVLYLLQVLPMKLGGPPQNGLSVSRRWNAACKAVIFSLQYGDWVMLLLILWMVVYLCKFVWDIGKPVADSKYMQEYQRLFEALGTAAAFTLPLFIIWIPFVGDSYGADDHGWCEMDVKESCNKTGNLSGIGYVLGTWYLPAIIVTLACTVGMVLAIVILWRKYKRQGLTHQMRQAIMKGVAPITYLVLYNVINVIDSANLIYHGVVSQDEWNGRIDYGLWLTHAVTGPARAMTIPFAFFLSQFFTEWCSGKNHREGYVRLN
jgi:hypothetical protein